MKLVKRWVRQRRKALVPLVTSTVGVLVQWASTGVLDTAELATLGGGIVTSFLVWLISNGDEIVATVED